MGLNVTISGISIFWEGLIGARSSGDMLIRENPSDLRDGFGLSVSETSRGRR